MALDFPTDETLPLRLTSAGAGKPFKGSIRLHSNGGRNFVQITLDSGYIGETDVTDQYDSNDADRGDIGPFTMCLSKTASTDSFWGFGGIAVVKSQNKYWLLCMSVLVNHQPFGFGVVPHGVKDAVFARFRVSRGRVEVGTILIPSPTNNAMFFFATGSLRRIPINVNDNDIDWESGGRNYVGFRCLHDVIDNKPVHGFAGTSAISFDLRLLSGDDWEATLISSLIAVNNSLEAADPGFPFPTQSFRMIIAPPSSYAAGLPYGGSIHLSVVRGRPSVTIVSGSNPAATVPVAYDSSRAKYGVIGPFSVVIGGATWNFGQITVFEFANKNYLVSYQLNIGSSPFSLTGLPLPVTAVRGQFAVSQNQSIIGRLTVLSDCAGQFHPGNGGPPDPVAIVEQNVAWTHDAEHFFGFLFIVGLRYTPQTVIPDFGYLGGSVSPAKTDDDWEASLIGPLV